MLVQAGSKQANQPPPVTQISKLVRFEGFRVELFEDASDPAADVETLAEAGGYESISSPVAGFSPTASVSGCSEDGGSGSGSDGTDSRHVVLCSTEGLGCSGELKLLLSWQTAAQEHPQITGALSLLPLQIQLHPHHLTLLSHLSACLGEASAMQEEVRAAKTAAGGGGEPSTSRSVIEDLLVPDAGASRFVEALSWGFGGDVGPSYGYDEWEDATSGRGGGMTASAATTSAADDFFDCEPMFDSIRSGISSFASMVGTGGGSATPAADPEPPPAEGAAWELECATSNLSVVLWYEDAALSSVSDYRPRFMLECADLALSVGSAVPEGVECSIRLYRLEVRCKEASPA